MNKHGDIEEGDYKIQLGHVFTALNRGLNTRHKIGNFDKKERETLSVFPGDLEPCG